MPNKIRFPPEIYLIGAQKAGTTSLAFLLDQHPNIVLSKPKEPHFYTRDWDRGLDWYRSIFRGPADAVLVDASPSYSNAPFVSTSSTERTRSPTAGVPERIYRLRPDAKFIYVLRDPISRTYSAYYHAVRAGEEKRPLEEALTPDSTYVRVSCYYYQITQYLEYFDIGAFLFVNFRDFVRDPISVAARCAAFMDSSLASFDFVDDAIRNKSFQYNKLGFLIQEKIGGSAAMKRLTNVIKSATPQGFHEILKRFIASDVPPISQEQRNLIHALVEKDRQKISDLVGFTV